MATTFRDIIIEAAVRSNVCPRKRAIPSDVFEDCSKMLKGILADYSNRNYITAYQNAVDFQPEETVLVGEGIDAAVTVPKIQTPVAVLYKETTSEDYIPLTFVSFAQFFSVGNTDYSVSWQPVDKNLYKIYFKPRFVAQHRTVKLIYNCEMEYSDNDTINLPSQYIELLTRSLAYKLSVEFPRTDTNKQQSLKIELKEIEDMIAAQNSSQRIITRNVAGGSLLGNFLGGRFIW